MTSTVRVRDPFHIYFFYNTGVDFLCLRMIALWSGGGNMGAFKVVVSNNNRFLKQPCIMMSYLPCCKVHLNLSVDP